MNTDTLSLIFKSSADTVKNSVKTMIGLFQQYSNTLDKTKKSMQGVANATNTTDGNFNKSKQNIDDMTKKLEKMKDAYKAHKKEFDNRMSGATSAIYNPTYNESTNGYESYDKNIRITQDTLDKEKAKINELEAELKELRGETEKPMKSKMIVPKDPAQELRNIGKEAKNSSKETSRLGNAMRGLGSISKSIGSKGFGFLKSKFADFTKGFDKNVDSNIKRIKKLALGLIGVRTAMSVLTKSVNAYLAFDSELQDSLSNSWNMLGSLLAPAIEFVARMFAIATNYVAQFVNALTGINLVAKANAKALQTQAKANAKANKEAQRGLLGMDEITNLPTEPSDGGGGGSAPQIQMDDTIKSFKALDDILKHLKEGQWHLVGEDIAKAINRLLYSIDWKGIKQKAYKFGWNFADFLNGLFEVDWGKIGNTMAESFNTLVLLLKGFVDRFSFIQLGSGLSRMLNHAFLDIDWDTLAQTINTGIKKLGDGIAIFLETFKWGDIGQKFGEFVASIDWGNLLYQAIRNSILLTMGIGDFIISFFEGIFDKLATSISNKVNSIFSNMRNKTVNFNSWLENVGRGLGNSIKSLFVGTINNLIKKLNAFLVPFRSIIVAFGKATGRDFKLDNIKIPYVSLSVGTPNIEAEGLYHLHEGEMVVPKRYNPNTDGYDSGRDNKQIIDLLISLNANMIDYANRPINMNMNGRKVAEAIYDDTQQLEKNKNKSNVMVRS